MVQSDDEEKETVIEVFTLCDLGTACPCTDPRWGMCPWGYGPLDFHVLKGSVPMRIFSSLDICVCLACPHFQGQNNICQGEKPCRF